MNFNKFLKSLFGDKSTRDMKLIQPYVDKVKAVYPEIQALNNDELRAKTKEIQQFVQDAAKSEREEIERLKSTIEDTPIDEREPIFNQIDKLDKEALDKYEEALKEYAVLLPLQQELKGERSMAVANVCYSMGSCYRRMGDHRRALEKSQQALDIVKGLEDADPKQVEKIQRRVTECLEALGNQDKE